MRRRLERGTTERRRAVRPVSPLAPRPEIRLGDAGQHDEDVHETAATHPDRQACVCGARRALKRRPWSSISLTTDGPRWVFLWRCSCGSDAFDHAEGS
jgi:hypothetical protein